MGIDLNACLQRFNAEGIDIDADFHTLGFAKVYVLVEMAKQAGYRKPKGANGSTARYFFQAVQRMNARNK